MSVQFDPAKDIPDLSGKTVLVTGGTAGLGKYMLTLLAEHNPGHLFFTGRSASRAKAVISEIQTSHPGQKVDFLECDLASLTSVRAAGANFRSAAQRLDIAILNAGIMAFPPGLTSDGYEIQFGTNHLGHALLIKELLPVLEKTASLPDTEVRVVALTSLGFQAAPSGGGIKFDELKTTQDYWIAGSWQRYGQSKLANILFIKELARRYPKITAAVTHPGVISTDLVGSLPFGKRLFVYITNIGKMITIDEGVKNPLWAATAKKGEVTSGQFYEPVGKVGVTTAYSRDDDLAKKLWEWTEKEIA